ncbi:MAG: hypothetical protein JSS56_13500 [Proteobacteria bacterium]|nr:hypothetical protein [Pseudomonadota bacterium]
MPAEEEGRPLQPGSDEPPPEPVPGQDDPNPQPAEPAGPSTEDEPDSEPEPPDACRTNPTPADTLLAYSG